jgi:hypothetical protein
MSKRRTNKINGPDETKLVTEHGNGDKAPREVTADQMEQIAICAVSAAKQIGAYNACYKANVPNAEAAALAGYEVFRLAVLFKKLGLFNLEFTKDRPHIESQSTGGLCLRGELAYFVVNLMGLLPVLVKEAKLSAQVGGDVERPSDLMSGTRMPYRSLPALHAVLEKLPSAKLQGSVVTFEASKPCGVAPAARMGMSGVCREVISLDENEVSIMTALKKTDPQRLKLCAIEIATGMTSKTIRKWLKHLFAIGHASRPMGPRGGIALTDVGRAALEKLL